eukprot:6468847-Amphidinium_carterae.1
MQLVPCVCAQESDIDDESRHLNPRHTSDLDDGLNQERIGHQMKPAVVLFTNEFSEFHRSLLEERLQRASNTLPPIMAKAELYRQSSLEHDAILNNALVSSFDLRTPELAG